MCIGPCTPRWVSGPTASATFVACSGWACGPACAASTWAAVCPSPSSSHENSSGEVVPPTGLKSRSLTVPLVAT